MQDDENGTQQSSKKLATCVKFTTDEFERIKRDQSRRKLSIPLLLKDAYFGRAPVAILMSQEEQRDWIREINQIGNNLNQIARKVNAGFRTAFDSDLSAIREQLTRITALITSKLGPRS